MYRFILGKSKFVSENLIVIFSDMIHESGEFSFNNPFGCTAGESKKILADLKSDNRIPDFSKCTVFVNGRTGQNNSQVENIRNFWLNYFKAASADLKAYDFDCGMQLNSYLNKRRSGIN